MDSKPATFFNDTALPKWKFSLHLGPSWPIKAEAVARDLEIYGDDLDVLQAIEEADAVLFVVSARDAETDIVRALDLGAHDYVRKPFGLAELLARVRAQLRERERAQPERGRRPERWPTFLQRLQRSPHPGCPPSGCSPDRGSATGRNGIRGPGSATFCPGHRGAGTGPAHAG